MLRLLILGFYLCLSALIACDANASQRPALTPAQAQAQLALTDSIHQHGQFKQQKYFKILPKPFISSGDFGLNSDVFRWQTLTPIKSAFLVEQGQAYTVDSKGTKVAQPQANHFVALLRSMINADFDRLATAFDFSQAEQPHCVILQPKEQAISQLFSSIMLCGQGQVTGVTLFEVAGNHTQIDLTYPKGD